MLDSQNLKALSQGADWVGQDGNLFKLKQRLGSNHSAVCVYLRIQIIGLPVSQQACVIRSADCDLPKITLGASGLNSNIKVDHSCVLKTLASAIPKV